jgi:hypothetical protein
VLLALVAALDLECEQLDVITAFLNGKLDEDEEVYVRLPDRSTARLRRALYGLRRSPRLWYQELSTFLATIGCNLIEADCCVFINPHKDWIILSYVDDLIMIGRTKTSLSELKTLITTKYESHDLGAINHYLGIQILRD